ncbi:MAG: hypothetical protein R3C44_22235 [Chloroflexota bacterium]
MNQWKRLLLGGLVLLIIGGLGLVMLALVLPAPAAAAPAASDISWQVIASGGQTVSSSSYTMLSTAGQPIAGPASSSSYSLLSGYWQTFQEAIRQLLLPIVLAD